MKGRLLIAMAIFAGGSLGFVIGFTLVYGS